MEIEISRKDWLERGKKLFGEYKNWKFICPACETVTALEENEKAYYYCDKRENHDGRTWKANGLLNGPILVIIDPTKPHDKALKENCAYVFNFAE